MDGRDDGGSPDRRGAARALRLAVLVVLAALGVAVAWARVAEDEVELGSTRVALLLAAAGVGVVLALVRAVAGRVRAADAALAVLAAAAVLVGGGDLPPWASAATHGHSPWFLAVTSTAAAAAVVAGARARGDAALVVFVVLAAAGGAMFARRVESYLPLLFLVAGVGLVDAEGDRPRGRTPFLLAYGALLLWLVVPTFGAVDVDRHLTGLSRVALAAFPLLVLGSGEPRVGRARAVVSAVVWTVVAAAACAAITLLEASVRFDPGHALRARLSLFGVNPNLIAPFFTLALPLSLATVLAARGPGGRVLGLLGLAGGGAVLWLTRSRAAILAGAAAVGLFVAVLVAVRLWRARPRGSTVAAMVGAAVLALGGAVTVGHERIAAKLNDSSMVFRTYVWGVAADAIEDRPVRGHGLLTGDPLAAHATPSYLDGQSKDVHAHDVLLQLALGGGVPAAALFLVLLATLLVQVLGAAGRLDGAGRALAAGVVAAAGGLFTANLIDLGLSNHTPVALHLGVLLGVGALLVNRARDGRDGAREAARGGITRALTAAAAVLTLAWTAVQIAGEVGTMRVRRAVDENDLASADRWTEALRTVNPHHLRIGLLRANVLRSMGRAAAALDVLEELTARHPLSAEPWEAISALELARDRPARSLAALEEARRRDPTGPLAAEWSLRAAEIELRRGRREVAAAELARALRFDTQAARRVDWRRGDDGAWITGPPDGPTVALMEVLDANRARLPELIEGDPVRARMAASALAFTLRDFEHLEEAIAVVDEYEALAGAIWVPLRYLKTQIQDRLEETHETDAERAERSDRHRDAGDAALDLAEGRKLVALGRLDEAVERFATGLGGLHDFAAERENLGYLAEEIVWAHLARGDPDAARAALPLAIYAYGSARVRIERIVQVADGFLDASRPVEAGEVLTSALPFVPHLRAGRDEAVARSLADRLLRVGPGEARAAAASLEDSGAGAFVARRIHRALGDEEAARLCDERLRRAFPAWAP